MPTDMRAIAAREWLKRNLSLRHRKPPKDKSGSEQCDPFHDVPPIGNNTGSR
jgi:hypothetical protein